jgi:UDP-N-acetylmuramate--alanine ligase
MTEIYSAMEDPIDGVTGEMLANITRDYGHKDMTYIPDKNDIPDHVINMVQSGDVIITLGAGDIWKIGKEIVKRLSGK